MNDTISRNQWIENQASGQIKVKVEITRHYNKTSMSLGAEVIVNTSSPSDVTRAYEQLYDAVHMEHSKLIDRIASTNSARVETSPEPQNNGSDSDIDIIKVDEIRAENKSGKTYLKVAGGRWSQWGVRLWLDEKVIGDVSGSIDFDSITGTFKPEESPQLMAEIIMQGGKPQKVKRLYYKQVDF